MDKLNSINNALDDAIIEMIDGLPPRMRYSVAFQVPFLDCLASTSSTPDSYSSGAKNALSLRRPASASGIHLAAARDEICRSCTHPPPAPLPPSPVLRPVATRPPTVSCNTWPTCEYKIHVVELRNIRCDLNHCMSLRQLYREAAKSGQRRLNFLLAKLAKDNNPRLWGPTQQAMNMATSSKSQLEMVEHEILRVKARERGAIAAVRHICILFLY